jgi:lipoprotein-releasing system permease protein
VGVVTTISIAGRGGGRGRAHHRAGHHQRHEARPAGPAAGRLAHVDLMRVEADGIRDWQPLLERLRRVPHVTAAAPGIYGQVLVSRGPRAGFALIKGIVPAEERTVSSLLDTITSGSARDLIPRLRPASDSPGPARSTRPIRPGAGQGSGRNHRRAGGRQRAGHQPPGRADAARPAPKYQRFRVAGIFHSGFYQYDAAMAFMRLSDAQRLFSEPDLLSVISFKVDDLDRAPEIGKAIEQAAGKGYMTTNWMEQNRELFRALKLEQVVTFIVIALIVIVAALNILIALTMMVMEKTRDIAVMMSFGVEPGAGAAHLPAARLPHQRHRHRSGPRAGLSRRLGRRALSLHPSLRRGLLDRHAALCAAPARWRDCGRGLDRNFAAGHALSVVGRRPHLPAEALHGRYSVKAKDKS